MTELQNYTRGVRERAEHHAQNVRLIVPTLVGFALMRADEVRHHRVNGKLANVSWIKVGGRQYAFRYDHGTDTIELRRGNLRGALVHRFDNGSTAAEVDGVFAAL